MGQVCCLSCTEIDIEARRTLGRELSPLGALFCLPKRDVMTSLHEREAGRLLPTLSSGPLNAPARLDPSGTLPRGEDSPLSRGRRFRLTERF